MQIRNEIHWVSETDYLESLEISVGGELAYYSRTYRYLDDDEKEHTLMRWDNFRERDRQYTFFADAVKDVRETRFRPRDEILRLVGTFRRNITSIELPP